MARVARGGQGRGGGGGGRGRSRQQQQNQGRKNGQNKQRARHPPFVLTLLDQEEGLERRGEMVLVENSYTILLREFVVAHISPALLKEYNWTHTDFIGWDAGVLLKITRQILRYPFAGLTEHKRAATLRAINGIIGLRIQNAHSLIRALLIDAVIGQALDNLEVVVNNLLLDAHWQLIAKVRAKIQSTRFRYSV